MLGLGNGSGRAYFCASSALVLGKCCAPESQGWVLLMILPLPRGRSSLRIWAQDIRYFFPRVKDFLLFSFPSSIEFHRVLFSDRAFCLVPSAWGFFWLTRWRVGSGWGLSLSHSTAPSLPRPPPKERLSLALRLLTVPASICWDLRRRGCEKSPLGMWLPGLLCSHAGPR